MILWVAVTGSARVFCKSSAPLHFCLATLSLAAIPCSGHRRGHLETAAHWGWGSLLSEGASQGIGQGKRLLCLSPRSTSVLRFLNIISVIFTTSTSTWSGLFTTWCVVLCLTAVFLPWADIRKEPGFLPGVVAFHATNTAFSWHLKKIIYLSILVLAKTVLIAHQCFGCCWVAGACPGPNIFLHIKHFST